jgi:CubicO group peptidase (beta-lactamase class C family)
MQRREFMAGLLLSALPLAGCKTTRPRSAKAASTTELIAHFEEELPKLMDAFKVAGLSVAVVDNAKTVWRRGFGFKNTETKEPVDTDAIFQAGSMSKPVFAYAALKLCEKGVIGLDTPLAKYAPEPFLTGDDRLNLITPRHLLSHTSGFPNWRSGRTPLKINFTPGSQYDYSGEGYYYLQSVITHLTGRMDKTDCAQFEDGYRVCATDIDQFLTANVLKPFGMRSSGYFVTDANQRKMALPHDNEGNLLPHGRPTGPSVTRYASAGALLTTPTDYANFIIQILDPKKPDTFRLKKETIEQMLKPHTKVVTGKFTSSWALGWQIQDNGLFNHGGDNNGFHCHSIASRQSKSAFVIMTNGERGAELIFKIFESGILNRLFPANP